MVILARPVDSFHFLSPRRITTGDRDGGGDGDSTIKTFSSPSPSLFHPPSSSDLNSFVTFRSTSRRGSKMCSRKIVVLTVFIEKRLMMKTKYFARRSERVKRGTALSRDPPATWILFVRRLSKSVGNLGRQNLSSDSIESSCIVPENDYFTTRIDRRVSPETSLALLTPPLEP